MQPERLHPHRQFVVRYGRRVVLDGEDRLEDRGAGHIAFDVQLGDQLGEGQLLVGVRLQTGLPGPGEEFGERRIAVQARPQRQDVDEHAYETFEFGLGPARDR